MRVFCEKMSETEWTAIPLCEGRVTSKKLGENSHTAVIRWRDKYRIIKVDDCMVFAPQLWIFGCKIPVETSNFLDRVLENISEVSVRLCGVPVIVSTWVLRSSQTIPPNGPRAYRCDPPEFVGKWSYRKPVGKSVGTRCVVLRRRKCHRIQYRGIFWQSPSVGDTVLIQGVNIRWRLLSIDDEMCTVTPSGPSGPSGPSVDVHRTCLIFVDYGECCFVECV
jgi:hypothetical protein